MNKRTPKGTYEPLLFLDVDGVLNRCGMTSKSAHGLEGEKVDLLRWIVERTGCQIVVSSTWRKIDTCMERLGLLNLPIIGATPILDGKREGGIWTSVPRGTEIQQWMDENGTPKRFVILDDDADMGPLLPHLVKTQSFVGLTPEIATEVVQRLKAPPAKNEMKQDAKRALTKLMLERK